MMDQKDRSDSPLPLRGPWALRMYEGVGPTAPGTTRRMSNVRPFRRGRAAHASPPPTAPTHVASEDVASHVAIELPLPELNRVQIARAREEISRDVATLKARMAEEIKVT